MNPFMVVFFVFIGIGLLILVYVTIAILRSIGKIYN